ncbi:MAG TPA: hypothetical protein VMT03_22995 [Polyangia bacterium]|nr:hypothetical protein [Polyangia bacterium]
MLGLLVCLLVGIAVAGVFVGPRLTPSLFAKDGPLMRAKRKFLALRSFALFRAKGDRAVLQAGEPPSKPKHAAPKH